MYTLVTDIKIENSILLKYFNFTYDVPVVYNSITVSVHLKLASLSSVLHTAHITLSLFLYHSFLSSAI